MTTSATKWIWIIKFEEREERHAANDIIELLSFFSEYGLKKIESVTRTTEKITYHYNN